MRVFEVYFRKDEPIGDIPAGRDMACFQARNWIEACHECRNAFGPDSASAVRVMCVTEHAKAGAPVVVHFSYLRVLRAEAGLT